MALTSTTDLAGLLEKIVARSTAMYQIQSTLIGAVQTQEAFNASSVQFAGQSVPVTASAHNETDLLTPTTISMPAVAATLQAYPVVAKLSNLVYKGASEDYIVNTVSDQLAGAVARTIDTNIANLYNSAFGAASGSATTGSALVLADFTNAVARLNSTGYSGEKVAVLHPNHWSKISDSLMAYFGSKPTEVQNNGFIGNFYGVNLFVCPWLPTYDAGLTAKSYVYVRPAIGLAHRNPIFDLYMQDDLNYNAKAFAADAQFRAVTVVAGAGVSLYKGI